MDIEHDDVDAAQSFYAELFGWRYTGATPPDAPFRYVVAQLDGQDVAGISGPREPTGATAEPAWNTYVAVDDIDAAAVFGWEFADVGFATMITRPGYGDHLAATVDPGIRERQSDPSFPPGFADAIAWQVPAGTLGPGWQVTFAVADRDGTTALAERLGGTVLTSEDTDWTQTALVADPQGGRFTASSSFPRRARR